MALFRVVIFRVDYETFFDGQLLRNVGTIYQSISQNTVGLICMNKAVKT
jgi:predicted transcriptional regulator YheO